MRCNNNTFEQYLTILCCPRCKAALRSDNNFLLCQNKLCKGSYPIVSGKPILIDDADSIFTMNAFANIEKTSHEPDKNIVSRAKKFTVSHIPSIRNNLSARGCLDKFADLLLSRSNSPIVLVIGCGVQGKGMGKITREHAIRLINTDVTTDSTASIFCDAHSIPFRDSSIDGVIVQAVLEHVVDPKRCVDEIHRVLSSIGIVYSEIPFMQQVHSGRFDFTRFTHLGHRRLFRNFKEIDSGLVAGPGTSLAWSYYYLLRSFGKSPLANIMSFLVGNLTGFWLKYLDYPLRNSSGALDAASCTYFLGEKSDVVISDKELIALYKGAQ